MDRYDDGMSRDSGGHEVAHSRQVTGAQTRGHDSRASATPSLLHLLSAADTIDSGSLTMTQRTQIEGIVPGLLSMMASKRMGNVIPPTSVQTVEPANEQPGFQAMGSGWVADWQRSEGYRAHGGGTGSFEVEVPSRGANRRGGAAQGHRHAGKPRDRDDDGRGREAQARGRSRSADR